MNETAAIVGIYGAVDEAVREDASRRDAVARLIPQYADPNFSWYEDFQTWLHTGRAEQRTEPMPGLEAALVRLTASTPKCRMRPRRLFAIALATRAFPEMLDSETKLGDLALRAVAVKNLAEQGDAAAKLLALLGDEAGLDRFGETQPNLDRWWDKLVETAVTQHLLRDPAGMRPRPCSGRLVEVPGEVAPAVAFVTEFTTSEVDFDAAVRFLDPVVWKKCMPDFWCVMKGLESHGKGGVSRYHEVVSSDCANRDTAWFNADTELDFTFWALPEGSAAEVAISNYQLSKGRPREGDLIVVDEGSLVVARTHGGQRPLLITTTKRIEFDYPFSSEALAVIVCALGYADVTGDLLCCAAASAEAAKKGKAIGADFPGVAPPAPASCAPDGGGARRAAASRASAQTEALSGSVAELFQSTATLWAGVLRSGAAAMERGLDDVPPAARRRPRERSEG